MPQIRRNSIIMSDNETDMKREEEQRREEDERLDTAEDERRGDDATEEVRHAFQSPQSYRVFTLRDGLRSIRAHDLPAIERRG